VLMALQTLPPSDNGETYTLCKKISNGRYGEVYQATDKAGNRVAVKIPLPLDGVTQTRVRFNLDLEATLLQRTNHPNFVRYIDHHSGELPYLVMEYVPETLLDLLRKNAITTEVVEDYIRQIPAVLQQLKEYQIAHCDLKTSNFGYVDRKIKVLDFGLAIPFEGTVFRPFFGRNNYAPPEFVKGLVLPVSDTFTAGKTLETLITGERSGSVKETLDNIALYHNLSRVPESLKRFLAGMIHPNDLKRKSPDELAKLSEAAIKSLRGPNGLNFANFVVYQIPNPLDC